MRFKSATERRSEAGARKLLRRVWQSLACAALGIVAAPWVTAEIPRTPAGRPDFSGTYDIKTLTPLERPEKYGDRLVLTEEEAVDLARTAHEGGTSLNAPSDPNREAPPQGGDGSTGAKGNVGGYNFFWLDRGTGAFRIDGEWRTSIITDPSSGRRPPMTAEATQRAKERKKLSHPNTGSAWWIEEGIEPGPYDDPEMRPLEERCLIGFGSTGGPPMLPVSYNNVKRIVQTEDHIMILTEMVHDVRIIRINAEHAPADVRHWFGDSVGRWEGDTLVVDTTNFNDTPALADASRHLHVVERFTRLDGNSLRYQFTVEDPTVWTRPWSGEYIWPASNERPYEYACHEANYSFRGILRGARILERETIERLRRD